MSDKIYDWQELNLQSMDLILCAGNSTMSRRIQKFQRLTGAPKEFAKFSHVAGVDKCEFDLTLHVQESTTLNKWAGKSGVQINPFDEWLKNYDGEVYVRNLDFTRSDNFHYCEAEFWLDHDDDEYESGIPGTLELLLCGLRLHRYVRKFNPDYTPKFTTQPHCTELQAKRLKVHSLLEESAVINRMPPWVWCEEIDDMLRCDVGELIKIKG